MRDKFDLNLLPVIVALYEERNATRAAQRLRISQPAVSAALAKLRRQFGDTLFVRSGAGMEPTPRAHALMAPTREILTRLEKDLLSELPFDASVAKFTATIAMSDVGEIALLPRILQRFKQVAPHASVHSVAVPPSELERGLEGGEIDLAVGYFPDLKKSNFVQQRLFTRRFACLLRADHPIRGDRLTLEQFVALEHAIVRAEGRSQEIFERFLAQRKIQRKVVLLTPHFLSLPIIIASSDLVTTVPQTIAVYCAKLSANVRSVALPFEVPRISVMQHWHRKFHNDARNKWLRAAMRELFSSEPDEWLTWR